MSNLSPEKVRHITDTIASLLPTAFKVWLDIYKPKWRDEQTEVIISLYTAWKAGVDHARDLVLESI